MKPDIYFAIPGDLQTLTGGYGYDRRLMTELQALGFTVEHLPLPGTFPAADSATLAQTEALFAALPAGAMILVDGLAYGVMDAIAEKHAGRLRIVALCHHPLSLETGLAKEEAHRLHITEKRALAAAMAVVVTSAMTGRVLTEQFGIDESRISVAPPGTDRQSFAECTGNPPVLLTVASLTRRKAHDVLINALAGIAHLPWVARFVGGMDFDPEWSGWLRAKVAAHGLEQRIHFIGGIADLHSEYAGADLFVLPSLFEGYGMAFAEALAFGLPVIAARAGAVPTVVPETAGILVPPADAEALAVALEQVLAHPATHAKLQRGARQAALHLPTWTNTVAIVANLINTVRAR